METDATAAVTALLMEAERAHGAYETAELGGIYDTDWARWYAAYAVEHGIGALLGRPVTPDEVAEGLASAFAEFDAADPKPAEGWAAFVARSLVERR